MNPRECDAWLKMALAEDAARNDITSRSVIPQKRRIKAAVIAKEQGMLAGIDFAARVFTLQDNDLSVRTLKKDGSAITPGQVVLTVEGSAQPILAAERTALNLLGHLSGIATLTSQFVRRVRPFKVAILDTRKTLPGLRLLEKYAVRVGGGQNHRAGLQDAILIKTNHLKVLGQETGDRGQAIQEAVARARKRYPRTSLEIEVTTIKEFRAALEAQVDMVLLDNRPLKTIKTAVNLRNLSRVPRPMSPVLEVSGGVTLANVRAIAATGVERISIGRLTHSAPSLDVSLHVI